MDAGNLALRTVPLLGLGVLLVAGGSPAQGESLGVFESRDASFELVRIADGLKVPWGLAFLPDGRMLVTERPGRLQLVDPRTGALSRVRGVPDIADGGQGGLLDVIVHPRYQTNGWIYLSYSASSRKGRTTRVARARLDGDELIDLEVIFVAEPVFATRHHFGSRLAIDGDGYLFITVGDRGQRYEAQKLSAHMGKVIRLHDDGRVPADNPFATRSGARPEIYSYGHRNLQGLALEPESGAPWVHEHGPMGGDEVNRIRPGRNYGWPVITYGEEYSGGKIGEGTAKPGMEQPVKYYVPSIAPSGMTFYSGEAFPQWQGDLFIGALKLTHLNRLVMRDGQVQAEERLLEELAYRVRNVVQGPGGLLYLLVDEGMVLRLQPPGS